MSENINGIDLIDPIKPINQLSEIENKLGKNEGFKDFQKLFNSLDQSQKDKFITILKINPNAEKYYDYEEGEKLPNINEKNKFDEFLEKYGNDVIINLDFNTDIIKKTDEKIKQTADINFENGKKIAEEIKLNPLYKEFFTENKIKDALNSPEYKDWINTDKNKDKNIELFIIEKNHKELLQKSIKEDLKNKISPTDKNSNSYKLFSNLQALQDSGLNIQAELTFKLLLAKHSPENTIDDEKVNLAKLSIDTSEYNKTEIHGDVLLYGDQVIDLGKNKKYIKSEKGWLLESSDIEFKENKEFQEKIENKNEEIGKVDKQFEINNKNIDDLKNLKELSKKDLLSDDLYRKVNKDIQKKIRDFDDKDEQLKNNPKNEQLKNEVELLKQELIKKIETFVDSFVKKIEEKNKELNKQKEDLNKELKKLKEDYIEKEKEYKEKLKDKDEFQRKSIKFINRTAADEIPQDMLNGIFDMIKSNTIFIPGLEEMNKQSIDLSKQLFGNTENATDKTLWQKNFIKFLNKLFYGDVDPRDENGKKISIFKESLTDPMNKENIRPETIIKLGEEKGIYKNGFLRNKMEDNLKIDPKKQKTENSETSGENQPNPETNPEKNKQ